MLTDQEKKEIDEELRKYARKPAAGPEALKIVQNKGVWLDVRLRRRV